MPTPVPKLLPSLIRLDAPSWLCRAVEPWRIQVAALWRNGGLMLELHSDKAKIPVLIELGERGSLPRISILDARIPSDRGASFTRALAGSLARTTSLRPYLERLTALQQQLGRGEADDPALSMLIQAWLAWPERDANPGAGLPPLPEALDELATSRGARAALVLYRLARGRGEVIAALSAWAALPPADAPGFTERLVDVVMLGLLGRRSEALDELARLEGATTSATEQLAIARAYETLEQREAAVTAYERVFGLRGSPWDRLRTARARGDFGPGEELPRLSTEAAFSERLSFTRQVVKVLDKAGRYDDTLTVLSELLEAAEGAPPLELSLRAATLHLWRRESPQAHARIDALGSEHAEHEQVTLLRGALAVIDGEPETALALLGERTSGGTRLEHLLWRAEAHLALGQLDRAVACVDEHIRLENSLVAYLLHLLLYAHTHTAEQLANSLASRTFIDALAIDVLPTLCSPEQLEAARDEPMKMAALVREILDAMGGNRSATPTWCRQMDTGQVRLERVIVKPSGREAAVAKLVQITTEPPDRVLASFDEAIAAYPHSPHPWTYRGELLIWLGRYDDALASFNEADARAPTRWSYVGRAAAYDLLGQAEDADHWTQAGAERFGELETATTHVYRGERLRKLGDWQAALQDLEVAVAYKTRRVGARINLALVHRALANEAAWERELARLRDDAPALLWEAGARPDRAIDEALLLRVLELMVGNRSSFLHTIIDAQGRFRVVPEPGRWIAFARLSLSTTRVEIEREIGRRWLG